MGNNWQTIPALEAGTVLERLVAANAEAVVTVATRSGAHITGRVGQLDRRETHSLVMQELDTDRLWFIGIGDLAAVCVHDATSFGPTISGGKVDPATLAEPVAPLVAKRELKSFGERISQVLDREFTVEVDWDAFDRDDRDVMAGIGMFLTALRETIEGLIDDKFARDAIAQKMQQVRVGKGSRDTRLADGALQITLDPAAGTDGRYTADQLGQALNLLL